jgi:hypothetical protein
MYREIIANLPAPPADESLAAKYPHIAAEWAHDLNSPLLPEHFLPNANKKVWWRCSNGHTWKTTLNIRVKQSTKCPECPRPIKKVTDGHSFAKEYPNLINEWHPTKNGSYQPEDFRPHSNKTVWWLCSQGHEWQAKINTRSNGTGCPFCYGRYATVTNNLAIKYPDLMQENYNLKCCNIMI